MLSILFLLAMQIEHVFASPECNLFFPYKNTPTSDDAGFIATFTNKGISSFIKTMVLTIENTLAGTKFPNQHFDVDLKLTTLSFDLKNIILKDILFGDCSFNLGQENLQNQVDIKGISFTVNFAYALKQTTAPYISDEGTGVISITGGEFFGATSFGVSSTCAYHKKISVTDLNFDLDKLDIHLTSGSSSILNPFLKLIMPALKEFIKNLLPDLLIGVINDSVNEPLIKEVECKREIRVINSNHARVFCMDSRTLNFFSTKDYVSLRYPGQTYFATMDPHNHRNFTDNSTVDEQPGPLQILPSVVNSNDVQFIIDKSAFTSAYYTWQKYDNTYDCSISKVTKGASEYFTMDLLKGIFPNIEYIAPYMSDSVVRVTNKVPPAVSSIDYVGVVVVLDQRLHFSLNGKTIAIFDVNIKALAAPAMDTYVHSMWQNMTTFYLGFSWGQAETHVIELCQDLKVAEENLDEFFSGFFTDVIGPLIANASKQRSVLSDNAFFFSEKPYTVSYYPPNYCAITLNIID